MSQYAVELGALGFQAVLTSLLALVYYGLWRQQRRPYFATWAAAWGIYAVRLGFISAFLVTRRDVWLFAHQAATGLTAILLLYASLQFARGARWRRRLPVFAALAVAWAYAAIYVFRDMRLTGTSAAVMLSAVTLGTGFVFWKHRQRAPSMGATILAATFTLWGLHHLDYPLLRQFGIAVVYGVFADVLFIVAAAVGTLFLVLYDGRQALEARNAQLEQLTHQLTRTQENERKRIARELHDQAGQVLTAAKIQLDLEGRSEAGELVGKALAQVRDLSNLLRPSVLDDLGLLPALRGLIEDFGHRTRIASVLEVTGPLGTLNPDLQVVVYRITQEALTNVARHAAAEHVTVRLEQSNGSVRLSVDDDGRGVTGRPTPHLGLLGMRERVTAVGGSFEAGGGPGKGFQIVAVLPTEAVEGGGAA